MAQAICMLGEDHLDLMISWTVIQMQIYARADLMQVHERARTVLININPATQNNCFYF